MQMIFNIITASSCELRKAMRMSQTCLGCQEIELGRVLNRLSPLFHFLFIHCFLLNFIFVIYTKESCTLCVCMCVCMYV